MCRPVRAATLAALALLLLSAAAGAQPSRREPEAVRLVMVTFERRAGPYFARHPERYRPFLAEQREAVLELLFGDSPSRVRAGDVVVLFADGAEPEFPATTGLPATAGSEQVARALLSMLQLPARVPGSDPTGRFWIVQVAGDSTRREVDAALRAGITCPLAGAWGECDERDPVWGAGPPGDAARGFSRPLLTLPLQYRLAEAGVRARSGRLADEVYWIWVQAGERVNETNSLAAEILRDFQPRDAAEAVARFRDANLDAMGVRLVPGQERTPAARAEGGATLWSVTSARLESLLTPNATLPLALQGRGRGGWRDLAREPPPPSTSWWPAPPPLLDSAALRLSLAPPASDRSAEILRAGGDATCAVPSASGRAPRRIVLEFDVAPGRQHADLRPASVRSLSQLAARCRTGAGRLSRAVHDLFRSEGEWALELRAWAQVGAPLTADSLRAPPLLATTRLRRSWRQYYFRSGEWLAGAGVAFVLLLSVVHLVQGWRRSRQNTRVTIVVAPAGEPQTGELGVDGPQTGEPGVDEPEADRVRLKPGKGARGLGRVRLRLMHVSGPERRSGYTLRVTGVGFPSEVPVAPGKPASRVVVLNDPAVAPSSQPAEVTVEFEERVSADGRGGMPLELALYAPDDVLDLDRVLPLHWLHAGIELSAELAPTHSKVEPVRSTLYVPCSVWVDRVAATEPTLEIEPRGTFYRHGLRPPAGSEARAAARLGELRVHHRAAGVVARPYPIRLCLEVTGRLTGPSGGEATAVPVSFARDDPTKATDERLVDEPESLIPLYVWRQPFAALEGAGELEVCVTGTWEEKFEHRPAASLPLPRVEIRLPVYPVAQLWGVAVDFGTSGTRVAVLKEGEAPENTLNVALPRYLAPGASGAVELTGELGSALAVGADGRLVLAGEDALLKGADPDSSLKEALMKPGSRKREWALAHQLVSLLSECVEGSRRRDQPLDVCRWLDGRWTFDQFPLPRDWRYLLLVTIPDTFTEADRDSFLDCFAGWSGKVRVLPLREAEAVVFGSLMRDPESQPERTLVVDVGAGSVDYAAVRSTFQDGSLRRLYVEGLAVSRAAGNAYDKALARSLPEIAAADRRTWRETKEQEYSDPEAVGGTLTSDMENALRSAALREHFRLAIDHPIEALRGRLSGQAKGSGPRFDRVVLSGRGSLALGWKRRLVEVLQATELVAAHEPESEWLHWLHGGSVLDRADRLKAAVVEGALAFVSHGDARLHTSQEILRNHLVLVVQTGSRYHAFTVVNAGEHLPETGLSRPVKPEKIGRWTDARLVFSSHPPAANGDADAFARVLWARSGRPSLASEEEGRLTGDVDPPVVRFAADIPLGDGAGDRGTVTVRRGGEVSFRWTLP
jgi:hypothetical protein